MKPSVCTLLILGAALIHGCGGDSIELGKTDGSVRMLTVAPEPIDKLDILFVIDDSGSMRPNQEALIAAAGDALFAQLEQELGGMPDIHLGVISSNVGTGPEGGGGEACMGNGDNGVFYTGPNHSCLGADDWFVVNEDDGAGGRQSNYDGPLEEAFACLAALGNTGCGFEQHLESMRRALDGRNPQNDGFVRDDAMLLVMVLADEDDCSAKDRTIFDPEQDDIDAPLGELASFRCFEFGVVCDEDDDPRALGPRSGCTSREDSPYLRSIAFYRQFLTDLKSDPTMVMVAGIVGDRGPIEVIIHPQTDERWLAPLCGELPVELPSEQRIAFPAVRLHSLLEQFPSRYAFSSVCESDMTSNLRRITAQTAAAMDRRPCLTGIPADGDSARGGIQPQCKVFDVLAPDTDTELRTEIVACQSADDPGPCFWIEEDRSECTVSPSHLAVRVNRPGSAPAGAHLIAECVEAPAS